MPLCAVMYIRKLQLIAGKSLLRLSAAEVFVFIDTYSRDLKAKFLNLFSSGKTENEIMEELFLSKSGINKIIFAGSKNPMSKLTEEIVLSIYNEPKELTNREISNKYRVPYERVRLIRNGEIWKSVTQTQGSTTSRKA